MPNPEKSDRNQRVREFYQAGLSRRQIAETFGISLARVYQIVGGSSGFAHGVSGYTNHNCRCVECREAWRTRNRKYRRARRNQQPNSHGASTYTNWGCRCDVCRDAWALMSRRWRGSDKTGPIRRAR